AARVVLNRGREDVAGGCGQFIHQHGDRLSVGDDIAFGVRGGLAGDHNIVERGGIGAPTHRVVGGGGFGLDICEEGGRLLVRGTGGSHYRPRDRDSPFGGSAKLERDGAPLRGHYVGEQGVHIRAAATWVAHHVNHERVRVCLEVRNLDLEKGYGESSAARTE